MPMHLVHLMVGGVSNLVRRIVMHACGIICDLLQEKGPLGINIHFLIIAKKWKDLFFFNFLFFNPSKN